MDEEVLQTSGPALTIHGIPCMSPVDVLITSSSVETSLVQFGFAESGFVDQAAVCRHALEFRIASM